MSIDTGAPPGSRESEDVGRIWRRVAIIIAVLLGIAALTWLATPAAISGPGGGTSNQYSPGEPIHVSLMGMAQDDLVILTAKPRVVGEAIGEVRLCRSALEAEGSFFSLQGADNLATFCPNVEPVRWGTRLGAQVPAGSSSDYAIVTITPTGDGPIGYCGLDITYRTGVRVGHQRRAGPLEGYWWPEGSVDHTAGGSAADAVTQACLRG